MTTIRVEKRHRYTSIDRGALNDARLSFRARGILAWLLDKPDDWKTNADAIANVGQEGREAIRSALRELEAAGYLKRRKWRNDLGQWESEWIVLERPEGTEPRRETGAGYPLRVPGPQVMNTETNTDSRGVSRFVGTPDPECIRCHGVGIFYSAAAGRDAACSCADTRPLVEIET